MLEKREQAILESRKQIANCRDMDAAVKKKNSEIKHGIELLDEIIAGGGISDTHLRILVEIIVDEAESASRQHSGGTTMCMTSLWN